jgi:ATP-binding cassette, subfamily B, bacterial
MSPARQLATILAIGQQARVGIERIFQLLDRPSAIADPPDAVELPDGDGEIVFSDVYFGYGGDQPARPGASGSVLALNGFDQRIAEASTAVYGSQLRTVRLQARYQPLLQAVPTFGQVAVLAFGGWLALHHHLTIGTYLAFSAYIAQLMSPARQLATILAIGQQARVGIERIFQLLDRPSAIADPPDAVELPDGDGEIVFSDVHFGYGGDQPARPGAGGPALALNGFDLRIAAGERVALVGPSGSGKSTVAALISRFYDPAAGSVSVDGHDVRDLNLHSLRRRIGMVFEESFLFSDSVRANIAYGRPEADDEQVRAAARVAEADGFIKALPRGYNTVVGERGLSLSGGQRQRIALARAILADPRILILDVATSAVDAGTEQAIHDALRQQFGSRTCCWSRTANRRCIWPTASSSCNRGGWSSKERTRN